MNDKYLVCGLHSKCRFYVCAYMREGIFILKSTPNKLKPSWCILFLFLCTNFTETQSPQTHFMAVENLSIAISMVLVT